MFTNRLLCSLIVSVVLVATPLFAQAETDDLSDHSLRLTAILEYVVATLDRRPLTSEQEAQVLLNGADWIVAAQEEDGSFAYEYKPFEGRYAPNDNVVRQAGTLMALSEVYKHQVDKDPKYAEAIEAALAYFEAMSIKVESEEEEFWCIRRVEGSRRCDTGTVALVLVGILNYVTADPGAEEDYGYMIDQYMAYLEAARLPSEGFSDKYYHRKGFTDTQSPFYNGEAMFALARYYQYEPSEKTKGTLNEVFDYLSSQEYETPLYLWIMMALKDMQSLWPNDDYVAYARDFTNQRLASMSLRHGVTHNYCAVVEGLTSAHSVLAGNVPLSEERRLYSEIEFWLKKTAGLQVSSETPYRIAKVNGQLQLLEAPFLEQAKGGFLTGEDELLQRIDFTQHCVSAYLQKYTDIDGNEL